MRRLLFATLKVCLGLFLGLAIAEAVFRWRDDGAFPHVNLYLPDAELGTTLEPFTTQRLAFTGNPATTLRINSKGFRGGEWPEPVPGELIVVGDSQVFGLGVEEADTFPAQLAKATGRQVLNAGVPTYGPFEYLAVARRLQAERPGAKIVFVFNVANDFFELDRPNVQRHAVWDGWAVRRENHPGRVFEFPGRRWLFSQSHLVFALRKLQLERQQLHGDSEALDGFGGSDRGTPSEGSWTDLLTEAERQQRAPSPLQAQSPADLAQRLAPLEAQIRESTRALEALASNDDRPRGLRSERLMNEVLTKQVGDVVRDTGSEMARSIPVTAELLATAAKEKARLTELRRRLELARVPHDETLQRSYAELETLRWALPAPVASAKAVPGAAVLDALASLPDSTLVVLPLDVQVSAGEWRKYGAPPVDMEATLELNRAFTQAASSRGLRAIELTEALQRAEPGAFLLGDLHLTPKGTRAAAMAVSDVLKASPAQAPPDEPSLPSPQAWSAAPELAVKGGVEAGCETRQVGTWLRVRCESKNPGFWYTSLRLLEGRRGEAQLSFARGRGSAVLPMQPGRTWRIGFVVSDLDLRTERVLTAVWREGASAPVVELSRVADDPPEDPEPVAEAFLECEARLGGPRSIPWGNLEAGSACLEYPDCVRRLACAQGHPSARPSCPKGCVNAGPDFRCLRLCTDDASCVDAFGPGRSGRCQPSGRERVCL